MAAERQGSLAAGVRLREVWSWAMYDFANSGYTTVVITAVFNAYFVAEVAGNAPWATFAWTCALAVSYALIMVTAPVLGAYADAHGAKKRLLLATTVGCIVFTAALAFVGRGDLGLAITLIVLSNYCFGSGENLIAAFQGSGTRLLVQVRDAAQAKLCFETMEVGVDGILLVPRDPKEVRAVRELLESRADSVPLVSGTVTAVRTLGLGDRVCVDTCSLLRDGEGILVGNAASGLFLIHAETLESGYVAPRPFRVNAGPVHAYVLLPDGKTRYLSELRAGDEVLAVDAEGHARGVVVGRVKIERRPLLLVEAEADGQTISTIVQNAETIRFVTPEGGAASVSTLHAGDQVLLHREEGGRHFGMRIRETITER